MWILGYFPQVKLCPGPHPVSERRLVWLWPGPQGFREKRWPWAWPQPPEGWVWPGHWQHPAHVCRHGEQAHHHRADDQPGLQPAGGQQGEVLCPAPCLHVRQGGHGQVPAELQGGPQPPWRTPGHQLCTPCCFETNFHCKRHFYFIPWSNTCV